MDANTRWKENSEANEIDKHDDDRNYSQTFENGKSSRSLLQDSCPQEASISHQAIVKLSKTYDQHNPSIVSSTYVKKRSCLSASSFGQKRRIICPYLGTIRRNLLDFDFEKLCSITLSNLHVYACLVCGKYYQGRGRGTFAYQHSLETDHYVYINLSTYKVYCLPQNYEVIDFSLNDIIENLNPRYKMEDVSKIGSVVIYSKALDGTDFLPGTIGLNNLKKTDFCNVIIQCLCGCIPLRNYLLLLDLSNIQSPDRVLLSLGELMRKIFNPRNFKGIVSPHEFIQAVSVASCKKFRIGSSADPIEFFSWLLHRVHKASKKKSTVMETFQGIVRVRTETSNCAEPQARNEETTSFLYLTLDLPAAPIFKDSLDRNMIPHVPIFDLLRKFDGSTSQLCGLTKDLTKFYLLEYLPKFLIITFKRFSKNNFFIEKNPTVVTFPLHNLDLKDYLSENGVRTNPITRYDLVANVCHNGTPQEGSYKCYVYHSATSEWYEMEDLRVIPVLPQMVALSESYIQIYQRQDVKADGTVDENMRQIAIAKAKELMDTVDDKGVDDIEGKDPCDEEDIFEI